jgi:hypothetical protein
MNEGPYGFIPKRNGSWSLDRKIFFNRGVIKQQFKIMKDQEPIKTQEDADVSKLLIVEQSMKALGINRKEAELRLKAMLQSGVLDRAGDSTDLLFQVTVDIAMRIPQLSESQKIN